MAAITSVLRALTKPGATLVVPADGYYQVRRYAVEYLAPLGITVIEAQLCGHHRRRVGRRRGAGRDAVESRPRCRRPAPLAMTCRGHGATLIVDNTTATPLGQQPLSLGADLVVASATKALSGHHDLLAGYVAGMPRRPDGGDRTRASARGPDPRRLGSLAGAAQPRHRRPAVRAAVPERAGVGADPARPSGCAIGAVPGPARRSVARGRQSADAAFRRARRGRVGQRRRRPSLVQTQRRCWSPRPASAASTARWTAGPAGATRSPRASPGSPLGIEDTDDLIADIEHALS